MERDVIAELSRRLPRGRRRAIARELQTHLEESTRELELAGWHPEDAARESVRRFGDPGDIAQAFTQVYRPRRRSRIGLAFGLAGALLAGAYGASGTLASATSARHAQPAHVVRHAPHLAPRVLVDRSTVWR